MRKHVDFEVPNFGELAGGAQDWPSYAQRLLALGPVGYWRSADGQGGVPDHSSHGHHGDVLGQVSDIAGVIYRDDDPAMGLSGASPEIRVPSDPALSGFDDFSVLFWIRLAKLDQALAQLVSVFAGGGDQRSWLVSFDGQSRLRMLLSNDGATNNNALFSNASFEADTWHHVGIRRAGSTVECFVDGQLTDQRTHSGTLYTSSAALEIGRIAEVDMDEVVLLDYALSDAELEASWRAAWDFRV